MKQQKNLHQYLKEAVEMIVLNNEIIDRYTGQDWKVQVNYIIKALRAYFKSRGILILEIKNYEKR